MASRRYKMSKEEAERARADLEYAKAVSEFWYNHYDELLARYPERYIAVKDPLGDYEVVATADHMLDLIDTVEAMGYDRSDLELKRITASPPAVLIWR